MDKSVVNHVAAACHVILCVCSSGSHDEKENINPPYSSTSALSSVYSAKEITSLSLEKIESERHERL